MDQCGVQGVLFVVESFLVLVIGEDFKAMVVIFFFFDPLSPDFVVFFSQ